MSILSTAEIHDKLKTIQGWEYSSSSKKLYKKFVFKDFLEAFAFMNTIAPIAEKLQHHPEWKNVYNRLEIELITHDVPVEGGAVTEKDFELAREIEKVFLNQ